VSYLVHQGTLRFFVACFPGLVTWNVLSQAADIAEVNLCITRSVSGCSLIFWLISLSLAVQSVMSTVQSNFPFKFFCKVMCEVSAFFRFLILAFHNVLFCPFTTCP